MTEACGVVGNRDVEPFVPTLIGAMLRPTETTEAIHKLGAVTFVQVLHRFLRAVDSDDSLFQRTATLHDQWAASPAHEDTSRLFMLPVTGTGWLTIRCLTSSAISTAISPPKLSLMHVQAVESPCLSILVPLLVKGLRERAAVARKTGLIIHNMTKVCPAALQACQQRRALLAAGSWKFTIRMRKEGSV